MIDITRNQQLIQVFSSIVKTSDLKISNQNNNPLTTMMNDDLEIEQLNKVEDVNIPIMNQLVFSFKDQNGNWMCIDGYFEFQLTIDNDMNEERGENE